MQGVATGLLEATIEDSGRANEALEGSANASLFDPHRGRGNDDEV